jgi:hypothetical protein
LRGCWTRVFVDERRYLVYGPSTGRLYLLGPEAAEPSLLRLLGLRDLVPRDDLADPALRIVHDLSSLKTMPVVAAPASLRVAYRFFCRSRHLIPLVLMVGILGRVAGRRPASVERATADIGRLVHGVEHAVGLSDCYARALLTSYLCLRSGRACDLVVGALAPTRMMHAWCSTDGELPYEASPEYYMYRPLVVMTLAP